MKPLLFFPIDGKALKENCKQALNLKAGSLKIYKTSK
jgi:hypothetical protein